jgi:hypothetical protein
LGFIGDAFNHDVFVSYSHGDGAGTGDSLLRQWSQSFVRELERELQFFPDAALTRVFLDQHRQSDHGLDPSQPVARALQADIAASALMLVLMSPHYIRSDWCRYERKWWGEARDLHDLDPWARVAFARIMPVPNEYWPREFVDDTGSPPVGHAFFDQADDNPRPFSWPLVDHTTKDNFRRVLVQLAGELRRKMISVRQTLAERAKQQTAQANLLAPAGQVVYLHGRKSQETDWRIVRDKLWESDFSVLPIDPEPFVRDPKEAARIRDNRVDTMSGCDAVLLLGSDDGSALSADLTVIGRLDRQQAIARSARPLPCSVLDTRNMVARQPDWPRMARGLGVQWLQASLEDMPPRIRGWLSEAIA